MLTIRSDSNNPTKRDIISFKDDFYPAGIISDILHGEFKRNKDIKYEQFLDALKYIHECNRIHIFISEKNLNQIIQEALKILYNIKE